jgi:hypothetical protein
MGLSESKVGTRMGIELTALNIQPLSQASKKSQSIPPFPGQAARQETAPQRLSIVRGSSRMTFLRAAQPSELDRSRDKPCLAESNRRSDYL